MILHCYYCSLGGERATEASRVAVIENLHKPLRADMFKPLDPAHDPTPPFMSDEWRHMIHRACGKYPWPYDVDPVEGPSRVLTDKGFVEIPPLPLSEQLNSHKPMNFETSSLEGLRASRDGREFQYMKAGTPDVVPLSKADQIKEIIESDKQQNQCRTHEAIAKEVGTSPAYVGNVARKMKLGLNSHKRSHK